MKEYPRCKGGDHPAVHAVLQQAVCVEHDLVREAALAGQRLPRGEEPRQAHGSGKQVKRECEMLSSFLIPIQGLASTLNIHCPGYRI